MKTTKYIICMLLACVALYGCQEIEEPVNNIPTVNTYEVVSYGTTTAKLRGISSYRPLSSFGFKFILSTSADFASDCIEFEATWNDDKREKGYEASATGLSSDVTYYCKLVYTDSRGVIEGNVVTFTTKSRFEFNSVQAFTWYEGEQELAEGSSIGSFFHYNDQFHINNVKSVYNGTQWTPDKDVTPAEQMMIYSYSPYTESYEMSGNQVLIPVENNGTDYLYGASEYVASENTPTDLHMLNAMSCIRFIIQKTEDCDIEGTVCEVQIVNADNAKLCANGWLHLTTGDIEPSGEYLNLVGIGCKFELSHDTPNTVERLMFPTSFGENQVQVGIKIAATNEIIYQYLPASEWKKGQSYNYPIKLSSQFLVVGDVKVESWGANNEEGTIIVQQ